jgi:hypothetical protein
LPPPRLRTSHHNGKIKWPGGALHVRFGSKADICDAKCDVRFAPNSDRESGFPARGHVRFTPESGRVRCSSWRPLWANSGHADFYSITSSARNRTDAGTCAPNILAVFRFNTNSNLVGVSIGSSAGVSPRKILAARTPDWRKTAKRFGP